MLSDSSLLRQHWVKTVPHVVDTLLLASAITLAWKIGISPLDQPWLAGKIAALLLYIGIGSIALRRGKTKRVRFFAWMSAQVVFFYIVSVAVTQDPQPWNAL
jgi:uncharacterized membrane protein SirB2